MWKLQDSPWRNEEQFSEEVEDADGDRWGDDDALDDQDRNQNTQKATTVAVTSYQKCQKNRYTDDTPMEDLSVDDLASRLPRFAIQV